MSNNNINKIIIVIILILTFGSIGCVNSINTKKLIKLTQDELIQRANANTIYPEDLNNIVYRDKDFNVVSADELSNYSQEEEWALDYYVDGEGVIKEFVIRKATREDILLKDSINSIIEYNNVKKIDIIELDCGRSGEILENLLNEDDLESQEYKEREMQMVISIIENCGLETLKKLDIKQLNMIWLTLQHNDNFYRKKYFKFIKELVSENYLDKSAEATMFDRILVQDGKKQIYGTQVIFDDLSNKWKLCPILEPENLEKRRQDMNLEPINEYLRKWNLKFE